MAFGTQLARGACTAQSGRIAGSWRQRLLGRFRRNRARRDAAQRLYLALVDQARLPVFYADWGVPDSRDGRLELVSLHAILLMRRLRDEGPGGQEVAQSLFDLMFEDLDQHLREWGVGDLSVGKHVRKLAQSFLGQAAALDPLLAAGDRVGLEDVLRRNVYTEIAAPSRTVVSLLAAYVLRQDRWLAAQDGAGLLTGSVRFTAAASARSAGRGLGPSLTGR
jgi:cytochrome b pre-mRNA-processing protein 3